MQFPQEIRRLGLQREKCQSLKLDTCNYIEKNHAPLSVPLSSACEMNNLRPGRYSHTIDLSLRQLVSTHVPSVWMNTQSLPFGSSEAYRKLNMLFLLLLIGHSLHEPRHVKTCLQEFPTRPDTNQPSHRS